MPGRIILNNILAGKTAMGRQIPGPRDHRIALTCNDATQMALYAALELSDRAFRNFGVFSDQAFTAFARKMVFFVRRWGVQQERPGFLTRVSLAADTVCTRVELLTTNVGFATLVDLGLQHTRELERLANRPRTRDAEIALMREKANPPPLEVFWESADKSFALFELAHPFHIWEEGLRAGNCLTRIIPPDMHSQVSGDDPADMLNMLWYWQATRHQGIRLFSLRKGDTIAAIFEVSGSALRQLSLHIESSPQLRDVFIGIFECFESLLGLSHVDLGEPRPVVRALLAEVNAERGRRALWPMPTVEDMARAAERPGSFYPPHGPGYSWRRGP